MTSHDETASGAPEPYYSQGLRARFEIDGIRAEQAKAQVSGQYADITYDVDEKKYLARAEARVKAGGLPTTVPAGWPTKLDGPLVWDSDSFPDEKEYVYNLTGDDKTELLEALASFKKHGLDGQKVNKDLFPLPKLGLTLSDICNDVYNGRGFSIIRGLDPDDYSLEDLTVIYLGISSYVGEMRGKQDQRGSMLVHVIKHGDDSEVDDQYSEDKPFHTDTVADTLCLFTQALASSGGRSVLASAYTRALQYYHDGKLITSFSRRLLVGHPPSKTRSPGIPGLTEAQAEALDAVHFIARKHEIKPRMERGDMRLINNMALLHRREAFANNRDEGVERHMVRIWLHNEDECWKLPEPLRLAWARVFDDEDRDEHWDLAPIRNPLNGRVMHIGGSCD
ncbi:hypothetical protein B0T17DRAFT_610146 [Bombardia bombarda]|uniref:TauD/TfdA-like domain-containing protein n=1 Tax=Bombardia bombarda TaxID=252184 RepID=A0AA39WGY1_9PEZI|nr:hypothetical protein B0T17DRAFT_610146 [Bombardia bombarda]